MAKRIPETGETTTAIYAGMNDAAWQQILPLLRSGGTLRRERTGYYYVDGYGGLTSARVRRLERQGVLRYVGVDAYRLVDAHA